MEADLARYLLKHYAPFMTLPEAAALQLLQSDPKKRHSGRMTVFKGSPGMDVAAIQALVDQGQDQLSKSVAARILKDHPDEIIINRCPKCEVLTGTPLAKQCLSCGHDWH